LEQFNSADTIHNDTLNPLLSKNLFALFGKTAL